MSGPGGATTKRDQRRDARRQQFQQRQLERQRERARQIRNKRIRQGSLIGGAVLLIALLAVLLSVFVFHVGGGSSTHPSRQSGALAPADGRAIDGMTCLSQEGVAQHIHAYLDIYINGQAQTVPGGVGIPAAANCIYPLHVHDGEPNIIHVESPNATQVYTLGQFFDIWGQHLSSAQVEGDTASASHPLVFEVFNANGQLSRVTSDPRQIALAEHETIVILYNSPNVQPKPFDWSTFNG